MKLKIYGSRGSIPVSHMGPTRYGGNTSCMSLTSKGETLIIDAGSGLVNLQNDLQAAYPSFPKNIPTQNILVSHLHLDHIIGLGMFKPIFTPTPSVHIYTCKRTDNLTLKEEIFLPHKPPTWPIDLAAVSTIQSTAITILEPFQVGVFTITPFYSKHDDITTSFHITDGEKVCVHLLDSELPAHSKEEYLTLLHFCKDADIIIADAAYSTEDYPSHAGWGHSTVEHGTDLARKTNCKQMVFAHLSQHYTDDDLDSWERHFDDTCIYHIAKDNMELSL